MLARQRAAKPFRKPIWMMQNTSLDSAARRFVRRELRKKSPGSSCEQAKAALIRSKPRTDEPANDHSIENTQLASGNGEFGDGTPDTETENESFNGSNGWNLPDLFANYRTRAARAAGECRRRDARHVARGARRPARPGSGNRRAVARRGEDRTERFGAPGALGRRPPARRAASASSSRRASQRSRHSASKSSACT